MSFTAGALLHRASVLLAESYSSKRNWSAVRSEALESNLLQTRTRNTAKRRLLEVLSRLRTLTPEQLQIVVDGSMDEQQHVLWLAICKRYRFIFDFATEVVREHYLDLAPELTRGDFDMFFNAKAAWHLELEALASSTRDRLRQTLFKMLREVGFLSNDRTVNPVILTPRVVRAVIADSANLLAIYPASEADLRKWATG